MSVIILKIKWYYHLWKLRQLVPFRREIVWVFMKECDSLKDDCFVLEATLWSNPNLMKSYFEECIRCRYIKELCFLRGFGRNFNVHALTNHNILPLVFLEVVKNKIFIMIYRMFLVDCVNFNYTNDYTFFLFVCVWLSNIIFTFTYNWRG
jgi:hypothetical protein